MTLKTIPELLVQLEYLQRMVKFTIQSLIGLRNQSRSESDLIFNEKTELEGKLMKFYAKQVVAKMNFGPGIVHAEANVRKYPCIEQFLIMADVAEDMIQAISERCQTVEELCLFSDEKLRGIFYSHNDDQVLADKLFSQYRRLSMALKILRHYVERLQNGEKTAELKWSGWFDTIPETHSPNTRASIASYLSVFSYSPNGDDRNLSFSSTISRSIPPSPNPSRHLSTSTIPRSKSDEASVGLRIKTESTSSIGSSGSTTRYQVRKSNLQTRPMDLIITPTDPETDSDHSKSRSSSMSQSPRTPVANSNFSMGHSIKHRFSGKQLLVSLACDYCSRIMFIGLKCKECSFKCHKKCSRKAPPSCGLPESLEKAFRQVVQNDRKVDGMYSMKRTISEPNEIQHQIHILKPEHHSQGNLVYKIMNTEMQSADSFSTVSLTSSASSSPFPPDSPCDSPACYSTANSENFYFTGAESLNGASLGLTDTISSTTSTVSTIKSEFSNDTLILSEGSLKSKSSSDTKSSESTIPCDDDCSCAADDLHNQISDVRLQHVKLRERGSLISEWVVPFQDIEVGDLIGTGRVGEVYKAKWHGEVALKILYVKNPTIEEKNDFKYKVQVLRRTRHENLILFMGACMEPPTFAIVCSLCKGFTLFRHIHMRGDRFEDSKLISIIQQTAQAMSYLHAREIVHKDLKTKNIFLENNKIVITDFGLVSAADIKEINKSRPSKLLIPPRWLCYQAPEIIKKLTPDNPGAEVAHYTKETDVYAFGVVWFELLSGTWPFEGYSNECIIWKIGKGTKQPLAGLEISREAKDILSLMWALDPENRPPFKMLLKAFERLPKRKLLIRSPSQPTYSMTRSANALII